MRLTDILREEHRSIERVLDSLEAYAFELQEGEILDAVYAQDLVDFLRELADRRHHEKEEQYLFPALIERGLPSQYGPVACMQSEHETGRATVREMETSLAAGDEGRFAAAAAAYVEHLRAHIAKEDGVLFPMADELLGDDTLEALGSRAPEDAAFKTRSRDIAARFDTIGPPA